MNVAIVILFWCLLGWKFAFAEFFGGVIIIAVVTVGFTLLFRAGELERLQRDQTTPVPSLTCHEHAAGERRAATGVRSRQPRSQTFACCGRS